MMECKRDTIGTSGWSRGEVACLDDTKQERKERPSWGVSPFEETADLGMPSIMGWMSMEEQSLIMDKLKELARELRREAEKRE